MTVDAFFDFCNYLTIIEMLLEEKEPIDDQSAENSPDFKR